MGRVRRSELCGSGFEEYYCDPPATPEEYAKDQDYYAPSLPLERRIETCLEQYRSCRRLDNQSALILDKYLVLGGIDATRRQFTGTADIDRDSFDTVMANDAIIRAGLPAENTRFYNPARPEHWDVDFTGVVSGFLSVRLLTTIGNQTDQVSQAIGVISNFLKYVLHHDVCMEYADDVKNAIQICEKARFEMPAIAEILAGTEYIDSDVTSARQYPDGSSAHYDIKFIPRGAGEFNYAARSLHARSDNDNGFQPLDEVQATRILLPTLIAWLPSSKLTSTLPQHDGVVYSGEQFFEVVDMENRAANGPKFHGQDVVKDEASGQWMPNENQVRIYGGAKGKKSVLPCGVVRMKPVVVRNGWDVPPSQMSESPSWIRDTEDFFLEADMIMKLRVGMKVGMKLCRLRSGLNVIEEVTQLHPSFYVFLPQELMVNYKEPVPEQRPAPSAENPRADDEQKQKALDL